MLKPIHKVECSPALASCQKLMQRFAFWLCDAATTPVTITQYSLQPPRIPTAIEANWLWDFLQKTHAGSALLDRARAIAALSDPEKRNLRTWIEEVSALASQFQPHPARWPEDRPNIALPAWEAFKTLMQAFYKKGLDSGLPYQADGAPVTTGGVKYEDFLKAFRNAHRLSHDPNAREVCVLCGGPLGQTPEVDHWIRQSAFPILSVCDENLLPVCGDCNSTTNKREKAVHSNGTFSDWFHPYLRPGNGALIISYSLPTFTVTCTAGNGDQPKADKLDWLLNLRARWTREFKAEYAKQQGVLLRRERRRIAIGTARHTPAEISDYVHQWVGNLVASEPFFEIHEALGKAMNEPARLASWHAELSMVR